MNAQGLDPFHTSGGDAELKRLERELQARTRENEPHHGETGHRLARLWQALRGQTRE